jgi:small subunit ribosomal protein S15
MACRYRRLHGSCCIGGADPYRGLTKRYRDLVAVVATLSHDAAAAFRLVSGGLLGLTRRRRRMSLTKETKLEIVQQHGSTEADTGSTKVQVALLTRRINDLTEHLRAHPKDHYSRRGLLKLVGRRRRFLNYLQRNDLEGYRALIKELGLRR